MGNSWADGEKECAAAPTHQREGGSHRDWWCYFSSLETGKARYTFDDIKRTYEGKHGGRRRGGAARARMAVCDSVATCGLVPPGSSSIYSDVIQPLGRGSWGRLPAGGRPPP